MYYQLLIEKMEGACPETKFFLLKYLSSKGLQEDVQVRVRDLVKEFGIIDRGIKKALDYLTDNQYLIRKSVLGLGPGRPKQLLSPGDALKALLEKWSNIDRQILHQLLIKKLLETTPVREPIFEERLRINSSPSIPSTKWLTNVRKLLLSTLLAKADQFGVVRDLSMSELASLIGLSKEQLRWHLNILKGSKYLFQYIPGVSVKGVKGKLKSVFVISLDCFDKAGARNRVQQLYSSEVMARFERMVHLAHALRAVNGTSNSFSLSCASQVAHWTSIYDVDESELEGVCHSIGLFRAIGVANEFRYERIRVFVGELAAALFIEHGIVEMLSEDVVASKVKAETENRKLRIFGDGNRLTNKSAFLLLSRLVLKLYREVIPEVKFTQLVNDIRIVPYFIHPLPRSYNIVVHYFVEPGLETLVP